MLRKNRKRCGLLAGTLACAAAVSAVMLPMHCEAKTPVIGAKQVGVAYLQLNGNTVSSTLNLFTDGQNTLSCDVAAVQETDTLTLVVDNVDPTPLGDSSTTLTVDSVQLNGTETGAKLRDGDGLLRVSKTDMGYAAGAITGFVGTFTPLQSELETNRITVTFTLTNLTAAVEGTTAEVATDTTTLTTTTAVTSANDAGGSVTVGQSSSGSGSTSGTKGKNASPKTGDMEIYGVFAVLAISGGIAFWAKKKG